MKQRIAFELSANLHTKFQKIAHDRETTLSNLLRELVRNFVTAQEELESAKQKIAQETTKTKPKPPTKHDWDALEHESVSIAQQRGIDPNNYDRPIKPPSSLPKPIDNVLKSWE